jgi:hypothetical protein
MNNKFTNTYICLREPERVLAGTKKATYQEAAFSVSLTVIQQ